MLHERLGLSRFMTPSLFNEFVLLLTVECLFKHLFFTHKKKPQKHNFDNVPKTGSGSVYPTLVVGRLL